MNELKLTPTLLGVIMLSTIIFGGLSGYVFSGINQNNQAQPDTFTLVTHLTGYVGEGGSINGIKNPTLKVQPGSTVTIILKAGEEIVHDLTIPDLGVNSGFIAKNSKDYPDQVTFSFTAPYGEYEYECDIPGHSSSMHGELIAGQAKVIEAAKPVDVQSIMRNPFDAGIKVNGRTTPMHLNYTIYALELVAEIEPGVTFTYYTFNGTVPGPLIRAMVGDTITIHLINPPNNTQTHSMDMHAVLGTGGGSKILKAAPGHDAYFSYVATHEGTFIYHCASTHIPTHISEGMYGIVVIEPVGGLPTVNQELYIGQNEIYTTNPPHTNGNQEFDTKAELLEEPTYVVFNGKFDGLTGTQAINITLGETVRVFFGVGGPNLISSFHMIGEIWDYVWYETNFTDGVPMHSAETVLVSPGSALMLQLTMNTKGTFLLVDHAISRAIDQGCLGQINVA